MFMNLATCTVLPHVLTHLLTQVPSLSRACMPTSKCCQIKIEMTSPGLQNMSKLAPTPCCSVCFLNLPSHVLPLFQSLHAHLRVLPCDDSDNAAGLEHPERRPHAAHHLLPLTVDRHAQGLAGAVKRGKGQERSGNVGRHPQTTHHELTLAV